MKKQKTPEIWKRTSKVSTVGYKVFIILALTIISGVTIFASEIGDRDEKIKLYQILYGEDAEVENIKPALSQETEELIQSRNEAAAEQTIDKEYFEKDENLSLAEAIKRLGGESDEAAIQLKELLVKMVNCQGTYIQKEEKSDSVYTADLEIYLKSGVPTCIIDYNGYMGFLEESEIMISTSDEYLFETRPIGKITLLGQEFFIEFNESEMHIAWGEGSIEHYLEKSIGDAAELNPADKPFQETELFQALKKNVSREFASQEFQIDYDEETNTFSIYTVISDETRQEAYNNASQISESWNKLLRAYEKYTGQIDEILDANMFTAGKGYQDSHCQIMIVDALNDRNDYYPQTIWGIIKDGITEYDFLSDLRVMIGQSQANNPLNNNPLTTEGKSEEKEEEKTDGYSNSWDTDAYVSSMSPGETNAVQKAKDYLEVMHFSHDGLVEQLEFEGFSYSEAVYGADHCGADWYKQAEGKAKDYLETMHFSYDGLVNQLEYEGFSYDEAVYGVNHCGADWYMQAKAKARDYLNLMSFSYDDLLAQLEYEGFSYEEAAYGASAAS